MIIPNLDKKCEIKIKTLDGLILNAIGYIKNITTKFPSYELIAGDGCINRITIDNPSYEINFVCDNMQFVCMNNKYVLLINKIRKEITNNIVL